MKRIITLLLIITSPVFATGLQLASVKQVVYLHGSDTNVEMAIIAVPFATAYAAPEWYFTAISSPFIPASDGSWKQPSDINLASLYRIKVGGTYKKSSKDMLVTIDTTKAKVPEGYPFTIEQVTAEVKKCVEQMYSPDPKAGKNLEIQILNAKK